MGPAAGIGLADWAGTSGCGPVALEDSWVVQEEMNAWALWREE